MSDYLETPAEDVPVQESSAKEENRWHSYVGNSIPWYVRLIWLLFWVGAVYYVIVWLFPALQHEIVSPP